MRSHLRPTTNLLLLNGGEVLQRQRVLLQLFQYLRDSGARPHHDQLSLCVDADVVDEGQTHEVV